MSPRQNANEAERKIYFYRAFPQSEETAAGKRLLTHAKRLELTARGTFAAKGGVTISATKRLALKP